MTSLGAGTPAGVRAAQIGFAPPDADWRHDVKALGKKALNVYLADLRENRALRSNERLVSAQGPVRVRRPAPMRVDCQYLVSAWSPSLDRKTQTLDEHEVLSEALEVLAQAPTVAVGAGELPVTVVPPEGFPKLAEFWGTMGQGYRWKPAIVAVVTIPVELTTEVVAAETTTRFTEYRVGAEAASGERRIQIAGLVRDAGVTPPLPVTRAWVQLEDAAHKPLQATRTNARGEFTFPDVEPGRYYLRVRAADRDELANVPITVPEPSGRYDLAFP